MSKYQISLDLYRSDLDSKELSTMLVKVAQELARLPGVEVKLLGSSMLGGRRLLYSNSGEASSGD
jgi:hypothetical protein